MRAEKGSTGMDSLMNPKSIAVVGASQRASRGTRVILNLKQTGFAGEVYAINPRYDEVHGFPCLPSVSAIAGGVDCIVVAIPANGVADVLTDAYAAGTRGAVVLSSGFGEGGHEDHERIERLRELAADGMFICGPNCYGVLNVKTGAAAFSGPTDPRVPGNVGLISQSGGFSTVISTPLMEDRGVGFSYIVSCGNQIGVSVEDYMAFMVEDPDTHVIAAFVEGFKRPERLPAVAARARELGKPIVVLASGRSEHGRASVLSHTGSLAGSPEILASLLRRHGYIQVGAIDEMVEVVSLLAIQRQPRPFTRELVVITGSGGESSHAADAADEVGLPMAELSEATKTHIEALLPEFGVAGNPVDGTGAMFENPELFPALLDTVLQDPQQGVIAVNLGSRKPKGEYAPMRRFAEAVAAAAGHTDKALVAYATSALGQQDTEMIATLRAAGVPYLAGSQAAVRALSSVWAYQQHLGKAPAPEGQSIEAQDLQGRPGGVIPFPEARELLSAFGIPVVQTRLARTAAEAVEAAEDLGYPVVLKAEAPGLVHKSDVGGVVVGCRDADMVTSSYELITANLVRAGYPEMDGVLVQPMPAFSLEAVAGVVVDPLLGPAILFGLGGVFVELIRDTVTEVPPLSHQQAREMVLSIRASDVLEGARGTEPLDVDALADLLVRLGDFALAHQDRLVSVDLNPVFVGPSGTGVVAVDAVVELRDEVR
jgi:acetyltransferase